MATKDMESAVDPKDGLPFTTMAVDSRSVPATAVETAPPATSPVQVFSTVMIFILLILAAVTLGYVVKIDGNDDDDCGTITATNTVHTNYSSTETHAVCLDGRHIGISSTEAGESLDGDNPCHDVGKAVHYPKDEGGLTPGGFVNINCYSQVVEVMEQAATNVTKGYNGLYDTSVEFNNSYTTGKVPGGREPIMNPYWYEGLCPVNVHWHLGAEHLSEGEYDFDGTDPDKEYYSMRHLLAGTSGGCKESEGCLMGRKCHLYDPDDSTFTTEYDWQHCVDMHVGYTYEIHWPHSKAGACGTPNQYQSPFYDGVFCRALETDPDTGNTIITFNPQNTHEAIGVQGQVFTVVNDERYYYPDLFRGMIVDGDRGTDIAYYTGSTTGTSRDNVVCSQYTPITWQVDRKCSLISASSFDKLCADMKSQRDDMSIDLYPHGARELVTNELAADNQQR